MSYRLYEADELGDDGYPAIWHKALKHEVRAAAGHRCIRCGHPYAKGDGEWSLCDLDCNHGPPVRLSVEGTFAQWRILTVHHLDGNKANCRWWNLAALCQRCHLQIQGKVQMARVWPWEHSEWFRPYAAGYYASVYLDGDLTRAEVDERLDELLALERIA